MKKIVSIITAFLLVVTIVGCSSKSKKYDENIDKIIAYYNDDRDENKIERKNVNIYVYEDVNVDTYKKKGKFTFYKLEFRKSNLSFNSIKYFVIENNEISLVEEEAKDIIEKDKPKYKEINNKNIDN
ncbi:hypothetical protein HZY83_06590 [Gemella sp. GH3]|uniref:hypothetical protein n=1 Tax=unclassified Gemella TaxID=2624949 RepID=UPI0015D00D5A|nr:MULTISPECIES: hypothetical protein [unclassified Gemella]MBF0714340.1 hypothetical protein [Gemella sp. GH3.1]NYS51292.1 hypothetical protein [Gemella sp. GH3]